MKDKKFHTKKNNDEQNTLCSLNKLKLICKCTENLHKLNKVTHLVKIYLSIIHAK
jgi:hypothetical protein